MTKGDRVTILANVYDSQDGVDNMFEGKQGAILYVQQDLIYVKLDEVPGKWPFYADEISAVEPTIPELVERLEAAERRIAKLEGRPVYYG